MGSGFGIRKQAAFSSCAFVAVALGAQSAFGHDAAGIVNQEVNSASRSIQAALAATPVSEAETRSVLNNLRLWPVPRRLSICFVSGAPALRKRVAETMGSAWPIADLSEGRLDFDPASYETQPDCGTKPSSDIRVDFQERNGHWSYVGVESLQHVPSMNFDHIESFSLEDFRRIVAHEFGHALGLEHEHQSPAAPADCGWNFPYIFRTYSWASEADMHANFDKLRDYMVGEKHAYVMSSYDKKSVMHYSFEPEAFLAGAKSPCFIVQNYSPSDLDKNAIQVAYAVQLVSEQKVSRGLIPGIVTKLAEPDSEKLRSILKLKAQLLGSQQ